jgi:hypothetical protein
MSQNLQKYLPLFEHISQIKKHCDRRTVLSIFAKDNNFLRALEEIAVNTVEGNINLTQPQKRSLRPHKQILVSLSENRGKKEIVQSGGGFLSILIPLVIDLIGNAINGEG